MTASFNARALRKALDAFFKEQRTEVVDELEWYEIDEGFGGKVLNVASRKTKRNGPYWIDRVQPKQFEKDKGLLYRPVIVNEIMLKMNKALKGGFGVMIKGPHGVGKSHTLVNVVRKLESTGDYVVTFIPDCETWITFTDLCDAMCQSFGLTTEFFHPELLNHETMARDLKAFIKAVDDILEEKRKSWIFVFGQVHKLFTKFPQVKELGAFPFPYNLIRCLLRRGHRTCIISASTNNETEHSDNQTVFNKYSFNHPLRMSRNEIPLAFPELLKKSKTDRQSILNLTGGMPRQIQLRLDLEHDESLCTFTSQELDEKYTNNELICINDSLKRLMEQNHPSKNDRWKSIVEAATSCLMHVEVDVLDFDRNFSVWDERRGLFKPVHPLVLDAYQAFFWNDLIKYIEEYEWELLEVCKDPLVTTDVLSRIFELLVIQRCAQGPIALEDSTGHLPARTPFVGHFDLQKLPNEMKKDGMYVPRNCNFPAIDLVWKSGMDVWGVKVHVSLQWDVLEKFSQMCQVAGWTDSNKKYNVRLVYLSPETSVIDLVREDLLASEIDGGPKVQVLCSKDIACLKDLNWPMGCSLRKDRKRTSFLSDEEEGLSSDEEDNVLYAQENQGFPLADKALDGLSPDEEGRDSPVADKTLKASSAKRLKKTS